jgi:uncharacterized protein YjbI with pentapeptide repeats
MAVCRIREKHSWIECPREAWDGDPGGLCLLHSRQEEKDAEKFWEEVKNKLAAADYDFRGVFFPGDVDFRGNKFTKDADFSMATFSGAAAFSGATFSGAAHFFRATFSGEANFNVATFSGAASFVVATFSGAADFSMATFSGEANFNVATFSGAASFVGATFSGAADFSGATFSEAAGFSMATFSGEAHFFRATFSGAADFSGATVTATGSLFLIYINPPDEKDRRPPFQAAFRDLQQKPGGLIIFQDLSLARAELAGTDLSRLTLRNVDWHHYHAPIPAFLIKGLPSPLQERLNGRQAVYDDLRVRKRAWGFWDLVLKHGWRVARRKLQGKELKQEDYARVEELYRGLMLNYGEMADFKRVGDFHYGEMEMHRRANPWRRWGSLYSAYWMLSGYGERPLRAFIWLLALIPVFAGLVWGLGINHAGCQAPVSYGDALLFIFEKATLQRPEWPKGITWLGKFLSSLSVLLLPGQAALFILALRNRLGRRR